MTAQMPDLDLTEQKIAIVGRAGRFPAARSVTEFWSMLAEGRSSGQPLSDAELLAAGVSRKALSDPNYVRVANVLPDMECFDAGFFGFSPREASILDPQHRHFLEVGWEALEDAGHMPEDFDGRIGVFAGSGMQAYLPYNLLTNPDLVSQVGMFLLRHTGNDKDFLPTRLSYALNLTGPSVAVQTACSTGLVSVHTAIGSLLNMECDMALAGGVTIELPHHVGYAYAEGEILSPDGICRAFDEDSKGTVFGSGAALVVLRRYEDAIADGDDIKAVILASAVNNDGAGKASYLAPSEDGQAEAGAEALALSGLAAEQISYIETHGTGTPIGDPIELAALKQVYGDAPKDSIKVGSVKTNIGHLDTAAGSASLIKVVEAMRHRHLPATLNFRKPNSRFDFAASPFAVAASGQAWQSDGPRRAAINSLGVGGTNAHVIVEEAPERVSSVDDNAWRLFPFSAKTPAALERGRDKWVNFLDSDDVPAAADMAFTLRQGRRAFADRFVIAARNSGELKAALADPETPLRRDGSTGEDAPRIVFLFPGGGAQYPGAGAEMLKSSPVFAKAVAECFDALPDSAPEDLRKMMFDHALCEVDAAHKLARSSYAIPALFILEYAYMRVWRDWGVTPDAILAHSVGEYAGAVTAGAMSLQDALKIVTLRGQVMEAAPAGAMTSVPLGEAEARALMGEDLDIAALNTTDSSVISGPLADIEALEDRLMGTPQEARRIKIDVAAHSRVLDGQTGPFRAAFEGVQFGDLNVPMISSMRGGWSQPGDFVSAEYWVDHLRNTVRFADAAAAALSEPNTIVIEVGPGQTLSPLIKAAQAAHAPRAVLATAPRPLDPVDEMGFALASLGGLWANGYDLADTAWPASDGQRVSLPTYAFEKERHWVEPGHISAASSESVAEDVVALNRITEIDDWVEVLGWKEQAISGGRAALDGRWLVFADRNAASDQVIATLKAAQARVSVVYPGDGFAKRDEGYTVRPSVEEDYAALCDDLGRMPGRILSLWGLGDHAGETLFDASYVLARVLVDADLSAGTKVTLVSQEASDADGATVRNPEAAAMLGAARVMPREMQGVTACLVDLPAEPSAKTLAAVLDEAAAPNPADYVALRQDRRFIRTRRDTPAPMPDVTPNRLRAQGTYVVTGGMGGIGRALALWLAETVKARVALVSRHAQEDPKLRADIEAFGGQVMVCAADVTDTEAMRRVLADVSARFGDVHGVIHAAGVLQDGLLAMQPLADARHVLAPKLIGAQVLDRLLPDGSIDFFAVISSSSVAIGPPGQTAYVAANAALEALASARGDGVSMAWGAWSDIGMAAQAYGAGQAAPGDDPILGRRSDLPDGGIRFETVINPNTDWRVREHIVSGHPVLPGTAYIELAYAAANAAFGDARVAMDAVSFELPMVFDQLARKVVITLQPSPQGYDLTVESLAIAGQPPVRHMEAELIRDSKSATNTHAGKDDRLEPTTSRGTEALQDGEVDFGPRWHSVDEIRSGQNVATGHFTLPAAYSADLTTHPLHPALVDMAATIGLAASERLPNAVYVPMAIGRVRVFGPVPAKVTSRAVLAPNSAAEMISFDVTLFNDRGAPVLEMENVAMRAVARGSLAGGLIDKSLTETLLATGIRAAEAPQVFARAFAHTGRNLVISPVSLDLLRLAMTEKPRHVIAPEADGSVDGSEAPSTETEIRLAQIWSDVLGVADIRAQSSFFGLGGHSLLAVRLFNHIHKEFNLNLPISTLFQNGTLSQLAALIDAESTEHSSSDDGSDADAPWDTSVLVEKGPTTQAGIPFFIVGGMGGNLNNLVELAGSLGQHRAIIGFQTRGVLGHKPHASIEEMAAENITYMRNHQPRGPYLLGGYSGGSLTALEMARQLEAEGETVKHLIVLDHFAPGFDGGFETEVNLNLRERLQEEFALLRSAGPATLVRRLRIKLRYFLMRHPILGIKPKGHSMPLERFEQMKTVWLKAASAYKGGPVQTDVTVFRVRPQSVTDRKANALDETIGWSDIVTPERLDMQWVPGDHNNMVKGPNAPGLADRIETALK